MGKFRSLNLTTVCQKNYSWVAFCISNTFYVIVSNHCYLVEYLSLIICFTYDAIIGTTWKKIKQLLYLHSKGFRKFLCDMKQLLPKSSWVPTSLINL